MKAARYFTFLFVYYGLLTLGFLVASGALCRLIARAFMLGWRIA